MLKPTIESALNDQLQREIASSYLYFSMAADLDAKDLQGAAHWMRMQAQEEALHAMKYYSYLLNRDGRVRLQAIDAPQMEWASIAAVFAAALDHERHISAAIDALMELAVREGDHATQDFLRWFIAEQVEEEATVQRIVQQLKMVGDSGMGLFMVDKELAVRPAPQAAPAA